MLPHGGLRLLLTGQVAAGGTWSTGVTLAAANRPDALQMSEYLSTIAPLIADFYNSTDHRIGAVAAGATTLSGLRMYGYDSGAKSAYAVGEYVYSSPRTGGGGGASPSLLSMVASTRSNLSGRSARGRMYIPADGASLTNHRFAAADCTTVATSVAAMLSFLNGSSIAGAGVACVIGGKIYPYPQIDLVRCDDLPDTQHRRQDKANPVFISNQPVGAS